MCRYAFLQEMLIWSFWGAIYVPFFVRLPVTTAWNCHSLYTAFSSNVGAWGMWACSLFLSLTLLLSCSVLYFICGGLLFSCGGLFQGEGCALIGRLNKFEQIIRGMRSVLDVPLTVKMRTGIFDNKNIAHTVIPRLRNWGVSMVTVSSTQWLDKSLW